MKLEIAQIIAEIPTKEDSTSQRLAATTEAIKAFVDRFT